MDISPADIIKTQLAVLDWTSAHFVRECAEHLGTSRQTPYNWLNGKSYPDGATWRKLGKMLGLSSEQVFFCATWDGE